MFLQIGFSNRFKPVEWREIIVATLDVVASKIKNFVRFFHHDGVESKKKLFRMTATATTTTK